MKKMTRTEALSNILNFGRTEQHALIEEGKHHEAYQIEHARKQMLYALVKSIKAVRELLPQMTSYTIDEDGAWEYNPDTFVQDDFARALVEDFAAKF